MIRLILLFSLSVRHCLAQHETIYNVNENSIFKDDFPPLDSKATGFEYNDILSILHNGVSNKILLEKINDDLRPVHASSEQIFLEVEKPWTVAEYSNNVDDIESAREFEDTYENLDYSRKRRSIGGTAGKGSKSLDLNILKRYHEDTKGYNENNEISNDVRFRRDSAIGILRNLFASENIPPSKTQSAIPIQLRQSHVININDSFSKILTNLTTSIEKLNQNIINLKNGSTNDAFVLIQVPPTNLNVNPIQSSDFNSSRTKREINDTEIAETTTEALLENVTVADNDTNVIEKDTFTEDDEDNAQKNDADVPENVTKTDGEDNTIDNLEITTQQPDSLLKIDAIYVNSSETRKIGSEMITDTNEGLNSTEKTNLKSEDQTENGDYEEASTRKSIARTTLDMRENLIEYIEHTFQEIKEKIHPIQYIKDSISGDKMYKIGYIIATIDSVDTTIKKINKKLDLNKNVWELRKLQQVLRKLDMTNDLLDNVLENINGFVGI